MGKKFNEILADALREGKVEMMFEDDRASVNFHFVLSDKNVVYLDPEELHFQIEDSEFKIYLSEVDIREEEDEFGKSYVMDDGDMEIVVTGI